MEWSSGCGVAVQAFRHPKGVGRRAGSPHGHRHLRGGSPPGRRGQRGRITELLGSVCGKATLAARIIGQMPPTAKLHLLTTLEDEIGLWKPDLIIWLDLYQRKRGMLHNAALDQVEEQLPWENGAIYHDALKLWLMG